MNNIPGRFSGRLRIYVTLVIQVVPLIVLSLNNTAIYTSPGIVLLASLLLASVGLILELAGKRQGRTLTLTGLGVQVLGAIAWVATFLFSDPDMLPLLSAGGLTFLMILIAVPGSLFFWNYQAGRSASPDAPGAD